MRLTPVVAAAIAAAIVAGVAVLAFSIAPDLFVWAAFIGWASYDHTGANRSALLRSSAALVFGVVMAWIVALVVASGALALSAPIATAISAAIASFAIVMASRLPLLSVVPATFYGFASTFAFLSLAPGAATTAAMTSLGPRNALVTVSISLLIGTGLGIAHGWLAKTLAGGQMGAAPRALRLDGSASPHDHGTAPLQR